MRHSTEPSDHLRAFQICEKISRTLSGKLLHNNEVWLLVQDVSLRCSVFGIPSAVVSWWRGERLVANNSRLVHGWEEQFYRVVEHRANTHQVSQIYNMHCRASTQSQSLS